MTTRGIGFFGVLLAVAVLAVTSLANAQGHGAASHCDGGDREIFITICP
jgi:hypothetical protein